MQRFLKRLFFLLALALTGAAPQAKAGRVLSAELMYKWLGGNNYELILKTSIGCKNISPLPPDSVKGFFFSDCGHSPTRIYYKPISGTLPAAIGGSGVNGDVILTRYVCDAAQACTDSTSGLGSRAQYWYHAFVTLPAACSTWHFTALLDRIGGAAETRLVNTGGGGSSTSFYNSFVFPVKAQYYVEATLNNAAFAGNSSVFLTGGVLLSSASVVDTLEAPNSYAPGAIDPENDSLAFELIRPRDIVRNLLPYDSTQGIEIPLLPIQDQDYFRYPAHGTVSPVGPYLPNRPIRDTFQLEPTTGAFKFNFSYAIMQFMAFKVKEYRNGILVGTTMLDSRLDLLGGGYRGWEDPVFRKTFLPSSVTGGTYANGRVEVCAGQPLSFALDVVTDSNVSHLRMTDNSTYATPGGQFSYTGQGTDSVHAVFSWTPGPTDTGLRQLIIRVLDTSCSLLPIFRFQRQFSSYSVPVYVGPAAVSLQADTAICAGDTLRLKAAGGANFTWSVLPGGSPLSSLSCLSCSNPVVSPTVTTSYVLSSGRPSTMGCKTKDTVTITVFPHPQFSPLADITLCSGRTATLDLNLQQPSLFSVSWSPAAGLSSASIPNPVASPLVATTYNVAIVPLGSTGQCARYDTVQVDVVGSAAFFTPDTAVCLGASIAVQASSDPRRSWRWSPGTGLSDSAIINPVITPTTAGTTVYTLRGSYPGCPDTVITRRISAEPKPVLTVFGKDTALCAGDTLRLAATVVPAWGSYRYNWVVPAGSRLSAAGTLNPILTAGNSNGAVELSVTTPLAGCSAQKSFNLTARPSDFLTVTPTDTAICPGKSVLLKASGTGIQKVRWLPASGLSDTAGPSTTARPGQTIRYQAIATNNFGCRDSAWAMVTVSAVYIDLPDTVFLQLGDTVQLYPMASGPVVGGYLWSPDVFISNVRAAEPFVWALQSTLYTTVVQMASGCQAQGQVYVKVVDMAQIPVPNALAPGAEPNGWKIAHLGSYKLKRLRVFNRWGNQIFETADATVGWDGSYNGNTQQEGVYIYILEGLTPAGKPYLQKGTINLVR